MKLNMKLNLKLNMTFNLDSKKTVCFLTMLTSLIPLMTANVAFAVPSKLSFTEDLITIMDLSKPAFFTLQDTVWGPAPATLPPGASLAILEGDPNQAGPFTMRLKLPANYEIPAHWCSMDEHISIISGQVYIGMGDKLDRNKATAFPAGSFARIPLKMHHYAWTTEETVIQLHGTGPWIMGYVDAASDSTKSAENAMNDSVNGIKGNGINSIGRDTGIRAESANDAIPNRDSDLVEELRKTGRL